MPARRASRAADPASITSRSRFSKRTSSPRRPRSASDLRELDNQRTFDTPPPGSAGYVLWGGGGTRLRIVKELAAETGGARFAAVPCLLRPWRGEAELLLAHLKENELRGAIDFVDLAAALADVKTLLERESGATLDGRPREWSVDPVAEYETVFRALCACYDGAGWDLSDLGRALAQEMAVRSDRTAQAVALELQARLSQFRAGAENT